MLYLGIDIAKNNHVASLLDDNAKPLFKAFSFSNTTDGANSLLDKLSAFVNITADVEIGMEATGHYSNNILDFLLAKAFQTYLLNPLSTNPVNSSQLMQSW